MTSVTRDEAERTWLFSTLAALSGEAVDVDALVSFQRRARMRSWGAGPLARPAERRQSPGRRLADVVRSLDTIPKP